MFAREALILNIDYPFSEKPKLVNNALRNVNTVGSWAGFLPVSIKLSPSDSVTTDVRWRYISAISLSFGGLGPSSQIVSG